MHDGKTYMDFEEATFNTVIENMKHIIFEIIMVYISMKPNSVKDILSVVENNASRDGLKNAFDYINVDEKKIVFQCPNDITDDRC